MLNHQRLSVAAVSAVVAALTLTACGSGDPAPAADKKPSGAASAPASTPAGGGAAAGGSLEGGWIAMDKPGKGVVLTVKGQMAFVVEAATGQTCEGTTNGKTIDLKCPQGATRSKGKVDSVDANTLKVTWEGTAGTDTFQKSDGKLPSLPATLPKQ
ncbi:hypothetical protein [Streptomyces sp. RerS4]|uniref:hypothetical protein n=1 Tax=Streptomyces sp. RerS4 TaxID=2942449 RepID=UPI00201BF8A2|nr:hypothetical protein [Streptomyces sp. RerS4]UQX02412.1 hypothetical protein M4D82_19400 [Streptomyces sp. RerS4]